LLTDNCPLALSESVPWQKNVQEKGPTSSNGAGWWGLDVQIMAEEAEAGRPGSHDRPAIDTPLPPNEGLSQQ